MVPYSCTRLAAKRSPRGTVSTLRDCTDTGFTQRERSTPTYGHRNKFFMSDIDSIVLHPHVLIPVAHPRHGTRLFRTSAFFGGAVRAKWIQAQTALRYLLNQLQTEDAARSTGRARLSTLRTCVLGNARYRPQLSDGYFCQFHQESKGQFSGDRGVFRCTGSCLPA